MNKIFIDINGYDQAFITSIEDDNNSDTYVIILTEGNEILDLTDKTVKMAYVLDYTTEKDVIDLNITNPTEGEITLVITDVLTKKEGNYSCQLLVQGENNYRKHSNFFKLYVKENLFSLIASDIIPGPTFSLLQEMLKKAETLNTDLQTNINSANYTIIEADNKKKELENTINEADTINGTLRETIEEAKVKSEEATSKNTELKTTLDKTLDVINNLDESQNLPKIRSDLTEVQNGLKLNQALSYTGYSIEAENTLSARTENMIIKGITLQNLLYYIEPFTLEHDVNYSTGAFYIKIDSKLNFRIIPKIIGDSSKVRLSYLAASSFNSGDYFTKNYTDIFSRGNLDYISFMVRGRDDRDDKRFAGVVVTIQDILMLNMNIGTPPFNPPNYFTGVKSFGEEEKEGDKYKITLVSHNEDNTEHERKEILLQAPLRGFDENICDVLYEDKGQVKVNRVMEEYTFTGDENWQMLGQYDYRKNSIIFYTDSLDGIINPGSKFISNNFIYSIDPILNADYSGIGTFVLDGKEYFGIRVNIKKSNYRINNLESLKKWLKTNKTTIIYQALNPKIEIVDNCIDIDLDTYSGKTYFKIENNLPGLLDFKVPSNMASIVQANSKAINELYDLINKLLVPGLLDTKKAVALKAIKNNLK